MMKIVGKITLIAILLLFQLSCGDWMEQLPPQGLTREEFWKTKEDVESVLMGAYSIFASMDGLLFKYGELRADMITDDINMSENDRKIMESNIYPDNDLCNWEKFYQVINDCNEVIKFAPEVQAIDNTFSDYIMYGSLSEAYFLRSLSYFYLVRIFRDVPYVTEPSETDATNFYLPKTNGDEILAHLTEDLEGIRIYATIDGYPTVAELKGRATKAAIDALLADISLWNFDYEAVIKHVQDIEVTRKYALIPTADWFSIFNPGNSGEGIFEFQFEDRQSRPNSIAGITSRYSYNVDPSDRAIEMFAIKYANELYRGEKASITKWSENDYGIWKYIGSPDGETTRPGYSANSANWIIYRYADVLLMKAEALSQLSRFPEALEILNEVRSRADVPLVNPPNSVSAYEDYILDERALELAFEGKRWFDLMRMGRRNEYLRKNKLIEIMVRNVPSTQKRILATKLTNPMGWYLPIQDIELEHNKNLVQNPYYNF
jgi:starch-binding outer membrane protein, SusD/RagB family